MENKLELKHLVSYVPYGVQVLLGWLFKNKIGTLKAAGLHPYEGKGNRISIFVDLPVESGRQIILPKEPTATNSICKPLLIPLSELTQLNFDEMGWVNEPSDCTIYEYAINIYLKRDDKIWDRVSVADYNYLLERHFDVFGLIEAGLALNKLEHGK